MEGPSSINARFGVVDDSGTEDFKKLQIMFFNVTNFLCNKTHLELHSTSTKTKIPQSQFLFANASILWENANCSKHLTIA